MAPIFFGSENRINKETKIGKHGFFQQENLRVDLVEATKGGV